MMKGAFWFAMVVGLSGCASDSAETDCVLGEAACELQDQDGDGVANVYDDFPEDPVCSTQDESNCGACGAACPVNGICDEGVCGCLPEFSGDDCSLCADPLRAGLDCDECADPAFTGAACDECASELKTGASCEECIDERFTGDSCEVCVEPLKTGAACELCKDSSMSGEDCDEPVEPNPEDALVNCLDYRACVVMDCGDVAADEMEACAAQAVSTCGEPLEESESVTASALLDCMISECDSLGESSANYECWRQKCMPELVACATPTFGDDKCEHLGACFSVCGAKMADTDWGCVRDCLGTGTQKAVTSFIDLDYCLRAECYDSDDLQQCKQEVSLNTPICQIPVIECVMND